LTLAFANLLNPIIDLIALATILLSLRFALRQEVTRIFDAKIDLVLVHGLFACVLLLEFLRNFLSSPDFLTVYTLGATTFVMWIMVLLGSLAYVIYVRPSEPTFSGRTKALVTKRLFPHGMAISALVAFAISTSAYALVWRPYEIISLKNWAGATVSIPQFDTGFVAAATAYLFVFLLYLTLQLVASIGSAADSSTKRAFATITIGWEVIAFEVLLFSGYLVGRGIDAVGIGNMISAGTLGISATVFRRSSTLSGLFNPLKEIPTATDPFTHSFGVEDRSLQEGTMLLEVDPSVNYERAARDFAVEQLSKGRPVFLFTSRGSPVWSLLRTVPEVRFLILTQTSYPKVAKNSLEVEVPRDDYAVLLKILDETVSRNPELPKAIVFDSVTDLVLNLGFEEAYKFLRKASEILSGHNIASLFLMVTGAHDERTMNLVRTIFPKQPVLVGTGLRVTRKT
jgi:hypothetical protein